MMLLDILGGFTTFIAPLRCFFPSCHSAGYDGKMHCMDLQSGSMHWSCVVSPTHSDTEIKSAPVVTNAVAIVGTHGGTVAGGGVFWGSKRCMFVSLSLKPRVHHHQFTRADGLFRCWRPQPGKLPGVDAKSGERLWEVKAPGAVFASPAIQGQTMHLAGMHRKFGICIIESSCFETPNAKVSYLTHVNPR